MGRVVGSRGALSPDSFSEDAQKAPRPSQVYYDAPAVPRALAGGVDDAAPTPKVPHCATLYTLQPAVIRLPCLLYVVVFLAINVPTRLLVAFIAYFARLSPTSTRSGLFSHSFGEFARIQHRLTPAVNVSR